MPASRGRGEFDRALLRRELLGKHALVIAVAGVEQQSRLQVLGFGDLDRDDIAHFRSIGRGTDGAFVELERLNADLGGVRQDSAAPAPGAEGADRRQRQGFCRQGNDRAMRRQVIRRRSGGCRHQCAVADQFVQPDRAVDKDAQLGALVRLPQQRHFVECQGLMLAAVTVARLHAERADQRAFAFQYALNEGIFGIVVEQEADRPAIHAEDRDLFAQVFVHGLQQEAIAAQRHDYVRLGGRTV